MHLLLKYLKNNLKSTNSVCHSTRVLVGLPRNSNFLFKFCTKNHLSTRKQHFQMVQMLLKHLKNGLKSTNSVCHSTRALVDLSRNSSFSFKFWTKNQLLTRKQHFQMTNISEACASFRSSVCELDISTNLSFSFNFWKNSMGHRTRALLDISPNSRFSFNFWSTNL